MTEHLIRLKECEFYVASDAKGFQAPAVKATFKKLKTAQDARCKPVHGRYVLLRTLSAHEDGPWATVAELGIIGK